MGAGAASKNEFLTIGFETWKIPQIITKLRQLLMCISQVALSTITEC